MLQALLNMILGMGSVFVVLIIICLIINCFKIFPYLENRRNKKQKLEDPESDLKKSEHAENPISTNVNEAEDFGAIVAAITIAITAYTGCPSDGFVVRSIIRRK